MASRIGRSSCRVDCDSPGCLRSAIVEGEFFVVEVQRAGWREHNGTWCCQDHASHVVGISNSRAVKRDEPLDDPMLTAGEMGR